MIEFSHTCVTSFLKNLFQNVLEEGHEVILVNFFDSIGKRLSFSYINFNLILHLSKFLNLLLCSCEYKPINL